MSGRDRERDRDRDRDRDRSDRPSRAAAAARTNEYFVPKAGIDREVITADICRYLGNDALVRPGNYEVSSQMDIAADCNGVLTTIIGSPNSSCSAWLLHNSISEFDISNISPLQPLQTHTDYYHHRR